jgi:hypothetical protein
VTSSACNDVIIGVNTHKDTHSAVVIDALGVRLADKTIPSTSRGD